MGGGKFAAFGLGERFTQSRQGLPRVGFNVESIMACRNFALKGFVAVGDELRRQRAEQRLAFFARADADAQPGGDAFGAGEVAHEDGVFAQLLRDFGGVACGRTGEDEIGRRGQDGEGALAQFGSDPFAVCHDDAAVFVKPGFVLQRGQRAGLCEAVQRVGVEAVFDAV